jgi:hypothetical protein
MRLNIDIAAIDLLLDFLVMKVRKPPIKMAKTRKIRSDVMRAIK